MFPIFNYRVADHHARAYIIAEMSRGGELNDVDRE